MWALKLFIALNARNLLASRTPDWMGVVLLFTAGMAVLTSFNFWFECLPCEPPALISRSF